MYGRQLRGVGITVILALLSPTCTLGGTGIGMAVSPPGQAPRVDTLVVEPGTLTRALLAAKLNPRKGSTIWVTHDNRTQVTMGEYAGISPEDGPKRTQKRGGRTIVWVPRGPGGIRVDTGSTVVVVPFKEVSTVRLESDPPPYWVIGTSVGFVLDVLAVMAWLAVPKPFVTTRSIE
jgi:hypothetical protein